MEIPANIQIKSLDSWCVVFFNDKNFDSDAPGHYYIIIPCANENMALCIITSQGEKLRQIYDSNAKASLVEITKQDFTFIKKPTVIDCNRAELLSKSELLERVENFRKTQEKVSDLLKKKMVLAIQNSFRIKAYIQESLPDL
ncbi:MAG: hypothetical protein NTW04_05120 [Elusimicrobia bacterium]|nr:hypothetical protein [Elusimicrobiota bacterium]